MVSILTIRTFTLDIVTYCRLSFPQIEYIKYQEIGTELQAIFTLFGMLCVNCYDQAI